MNALMFFPFFVKAPIGRKKPRHLEEGEQVRGRSLHMWLSCPLWGGGGGAGAVQVAASPVWDSQIHLFSLH